MLFAVLVVHIWANQPSKLMRSRIWLSWIRKWLIFNLLKIVCVSNKYCILLMLLMVLNLFLLLLVILLKICFWWYYKYFEFILKSFSLFQLTVSLTWYIPQLPLKDEAQHILGSTTIFTINYERPRSSNISLNIKRREKVVNTKITI